MKKLVSNITRATGKTPLIELSQVTKDLGATIFAKMESSNPLGSVKDRIAVSMIEAAEENNLINSNTTVIEPTSGNTGIGLAFVCASRGYKLILTMPETMSVERRKLLLHFGAELVLTPGALGMKGAIAKAEELLAQTPGAWMPNQFSNPANPAVHRKHTGPEVWDQTNGNIDIFVSGVGTGGTITGAGGMLKEKNSDLHVVAVEPADSPVLSGGAPGPHKIQGIGAGFIPLILNTDIIDEIITVSNEESIETAKELALKEGILCGISSGAAVIAAIKLASKSENKGKNIIVILPDTGERYLSTDLMKNIES